MNLIGDDDLDGWSSEEFAQSMPMNRLRKEKIQDRDSYEYYEQQRIPRESDWSIKNNEIVGRANSARNDQHGWLYYQRPLREGEVFAYEFYYEADKFQAWPTLVS